LLANDANREQARSYGWIDKHRGQLYFAARAMSFSMPGSLMFHGVPGWMQPAVHFSADLTMSANFAPFGLMTTTSFWSL
jgi:hypothetical protein